MGAPIGSNEFTKDWLRDVKLPELCAYIDRVSEMHNTQAAYHLLRSSACQKATYLLRLIPPSLVAEFALSFDLAIEAALNHIANVPDGSFESARIEAHWPLRHGGLGIPSAVSIMDVAFWSSTSATQSMIKLLDKSTCAEGFSLNTLLLPAANLPVSPCGLQLQQNNLSQGITHWMALAWKKMYDAGLSEGIAYSELTVPDHHSLAESPPKLQKTYLDVQYKLAIAAFKETATNATKVRLMSNKACNVNTIFTTLPSTSETTLSSPLFAHHLASRVGLPPAAAYHPAIRQCACTARITSVNAIKHVASCSKHGGPRTRAHDNIAAAWQTFLLAAGYKAGAEICLWKGNNNFPAGRGQIQGYRMDLVSHNVVRDEKVGYDVSVSNPLLPTQIPRGRNPVIRSGSGAARRAKKKNKQYLKPSADIGYKFSPLVFESTLGWDKEAVAVVRKVMADIHRNRGDNLLGGIRYWTRRLSFALARAEANKIGTSLHMLIHRTGPQDVNYHALHPHPGLAV